MPTTEMLKRLLAAFNAHDLDQIMGYFTADCVLEMPRGSEPWGTRYEGRTAVREGLATRFAGLPDVHYADDGHWVCGDRAVSTWLLTGTTASGEQVRVRGCDLFDLAPDGRIARKDSYWKIVEPDHVRYSCGSEGSRHDGTASTSREVRPSDEGT